MVCVCVGVCVCVCGCAGVWSEGRESREGGVRVRVELGVV